jgi:hydrogenase 3 maturation protease
VNPDQPSIPSKQRLAELLDRVREGGMTLVMLGIGNELRGDDGVGTLLAQDLQALNLPWLKAFPVGIALENSTHLVARHQAQVLLLVDAVSDTERPLGEWDFFPPEDCDSFIHSTHSVPLSLFVAYWKREIPDLEVHFLGINIGPTETFGTICEDVHKARKTILGQFRTV